MKTEFVFLHNNSENGELFQEHIRQMEPGSDNPLNLDVMFSLLGYTGDIRNTPMLSFISSN